MNLRIKTLREKGLTHTLKKAPGSKKRKKNADKETNGVAVPADTSGTTTKSKPSSDEDKPKPKANGEKKAIKEPRDTTDNGIKNSATASLTRKVMEEQEERNKRRKLGQNENVKSLFNTSSNAPSKGNSADYMTRGFSIGKK